MSMVQSFEQVTDAQIRELLDATDRQAAWDIFFEEAFRVNSTDGLFIGKWWHALHFLFTGLAYGGDPPLDFILFGATNGFAIADPKVELVHAFFSDEVQNIAAALRQLTPAEFRRRFVPSRMAAMAMAEIYPTHWWSPSEDDVTAKEDEMVHVYASGPKIRLTDADHEYIIMKFEAVREQLFVVFNKLKRFMFNCAKQRRGVISIRH